MGGDGFLLRPASEFLDGCSDPGENDTGGAFLPRRLLKSISDEMPVSQEIPDSSLFLFYFPNPVK
jgi:hypothetical protein